MTGNFNKIRTQCILNAKNDIRKSICEDDYIIHTINTIEELAKIINSLSKRLRDWYAIYLPEYSKANDDHESFVTQIIEKNRADLITELNIHESMGLKLDKKDFEPIMLLAKQTREMFKLREELKNYLELTMNAYARNLTYLTGALLGAKLIESAGSLKRLAMMPSSTIQLLGAEKALFRHLKTGARPPKHGIILQHPLIAKAKKELKGKHARLLADKINIAIKTDFFKGEFIGERLKKELEEKLK